MILRRLLIVATAYQQTNDYTHTNIQPYIPMNTTPLQHYPIAPTLPYTPNERWGAGVETHKNVRGEVGGWGRTPFNEPYAPSLSTIYDGA